MLFYFIHIPYIQPVKFSYIKKGIKGFAQERRKSRNPETLLTINGLIVLFHWASVVVLVHPIEDISPVVFGLRVEINKARLT